ncbi:MAG: ABC transporter permease, partial [Holophagales bacterium]|nr:ABC transporter permease [Holophagales bacterium]
AERVDFVERLTGALGERPEIASAAAASNLPMAGAGSDFSYYVEGAPPAPEGRRPSAWYRMVTPGYFETLGISMIEGRPFDPSQGLEDPKVIAVSERFAHRWFGEESPIGKRMKLGGHDSDREWMTIVAVVTDVRDRSPMLPSRDDVYLPHGQWGSRFLSLTVASRAGLEAAGAAITEELQRLDPALSSTPAVLLEETVSGTLWLPRLAAQVLSVFAAAALALAALGIYGVLAYTVEHRRRELGIRAALGADRPKIIGLVLGQGLAMAGLGLGVGAVLAVAFSGVLRGLLHGVEPSDPLVLAATAAMLLAIAGLASWLPARRAAAIDPADCLRQD